MRPCSACGGADMPETTIIRDFADKHIRENFPHPVAIQWDFFRNPKEWDFADDWLRDHCGENGLRPTELFDVYKLNADATHVRYGKLIYFKNENDAMLFKMFCT